MKDGVSPRTGGNIGFNSELHDAFEKALAEVKQEVGIQLRTFVRLYPKADRGPEARARRALLAVLGDLEGARIAMKAIRAKEGER